MVQLLREPRAFIAHFIEPLLALVDGVLGGGRALRVRLEFPLELCLPGHEVAVGAHFVEFLFLLLAKPLCLLRGLQRLLSLAHFLLERREIILRVREHALELVDVILRGTDALLLLLPGVREIHFRSADLSPRRVPLVRQVARRLLDLVLGLRGRLSIGVELLELVVLLPELDVDRLGEVRLVRDQPSVVHRLHGIVNLSLTPALEDAMLGVRPVDVPRALREHDSGSLLLVGDEDGALQTGGIHEKVVNRRVRKLENVRHLQVRGRRELVLARGVRGRGEVHDGDHRGHLDPVPHDLVELGAVLHVAHQVRAEVPANLLLHGSRPLLILELEERADRPYGWDTERARGDPLEVLGKLGHLGTKLGENLVALELSGFQPILQSDDVVPNVPDAVFNMLLFANRVLLVAIVTPLRFFGVGLCPEGPVEPVLRLVHRLLQPRILRLRGRRDGHLSVLDLSLKSLHILLL